VLIVVPCLTLPQYTFQISLHLLVLHY